MTPSELQPTSTEVQKLLAFATEGKSKTAQALAKVVREKFDVVMDIVENDEDIAVMVLDFILRKEKFRPSETQKFRIMVLQALENPNQKDSRGEDMDLKIDDSEDFGSPELAKLALSIRILYSTTWYAKSKVGDFSSAGQEYIDAFLNFYGDEDDLRDKNGTVKTKNKKSGKKKKEEKWQDSEEYGYYGFLKVGDMIIVKTIFTMLQSYLDALLRKMGNPGTSESIQSALRKEVDDGRWPALAKIVEKLKKIPFQRNIMDNMEEYDYSFDDVMSTLLECWDSYAIQIQDSQEEK